MEDSIFIDVPIEIDNTGITVSIDPCNNLNLHQEADMVMMDEFGAKELRDFLNERYPK